MAATQDQIAAQMVAQLRALDPAISAEIGTPERKIIDTVAQQIAESQVDLNQLGGALDITTKFGSDLDTFVGMFGFGRQSGAKATGFATFSRPSASAYNITIPNGSQLQGSGTTTAQGTAQAVQVIFQTTQAVTLLSGQTSVIAPIEAVIAGVQGNIAPQALSFANLGAPILGITQVSLPLATTGGADSESDAELKIRFNNTVFRNMAGTADQFLAVAVSTSYSTKANVLGPISRFQEYMQLPLVDDAHSTVLGTQVPVVQPDGTTIIYIEDGDGAGNYTTVAGLPNPWTTTPSSNPYAKYIYTNVPYYVTNGAAGANTIFYRAGYDFTLNAPPLNQGETFREFGDGSADIADPATTPYNPNVSFFTVYTGTDHTVVAPRPGDVILLEYSYMSAESRNDITRNITNCVDVYVNGQNAVSANAVIAPPTAISQFTTNSVLPLYAQNFRRLGKPDVTPTTGHLFSALYSQPLVSLPPQITVGSNTYYLGTHYWAVQEITAGFGRSVRARDGIEWDPTIRGALSGDVITGPYTGATIVGAAATSVTVTGYTYDKNIVDLQAALEQSKQITTDVLAHVATPRYFKLDITVVYSPGSSIATTNNAIQAAVGNLFDGQYFGTTIQLSDLLVTVRNVGGVQNVRWSNDVINPTDDGANAYVRVQETDINGIARSGSQYAHNTDFYLRDSDLPTLPTGQLTTDTVPGLIIRPRAQNTFTYF